MLAEAVHRSGLDGPAVAQFRIREAHFQDPHARPGLGWLGVPAGLFILTIGLPATTLSPLHPPDPSLGGAEWASVDLWDAPSFWLSH